MSTPDPQQITWPRQAAIALTNLLALAAKEHLPPLAWTVGHAGASVGGRVLGEDRRGDFGAWKAAITAATGRAPDHDSDFAGGLGGEQRLVCTWKQLPVALVPGSPRSPSATVTLTASVWPEEGESSDG